MPQAAAHGEIVAGLRHGTARRTNGVRQISIEVMFRPQGQYVCIHGTSASLARPGQTGAEGSVDNIKLHQKKVKRLAKKATGLSEEGWLLEHTRRQAAKVAKAK